MAVLDFADVCCLVFFLVLMLVQQQEYSELMEQAQHELSGTAQMYIKELWNLPIASIY
jgi:ABC-2 type transport system permease protein